MTDEPMVSKGAGGLSDEQLVEAYRQGQTSALDILFNRYLTPLLAFLFNNSFFPKDENYLLEVRDEIFIKLCQGIRKYPKDGGFSSRGPGSFHAWLWTIAKLECLNADKKRRRLYIPFSQAFPDQADSDSKSTSPEDNILFRVTAEPAGIASSEPDEAEYARLKLERLFKHLKPDEVKLMQLSVRTKYKDIIKLEEFSKYKSVASLKQKMYDITQKIRKNSAGQTKTE